MMVAQILEEKDEPAATSERQSGLGTRPASEPEVSNSCLGAIARTTTRSSFRGDCGHGSAEGDC